MEKSLDGKVVTDLLERLFGPEYPTPENSQLVNPVRTAVEIAMEKEFGEQPKAGATNDSL